MSTRRAGFRLALLLATTALLAACAVEPPKPPPKPATVIARPEPSPTTVAPLPPTEATNQPWASLVASFTMNDCNDSPLVRAKLADYTRSPQHFEQLLQQALPMMMYVQKQLASSGIPGEFVMLPMLESSYNASEPGRRGDPAGMWQLMPHTARSHGLTIDRAYDGRLDPVASTRVAIAMLKAFDRQFGDWRLADFAYNAGSGAVTSALHGHAGLGDAAIPDINVSSTSRKHLAKLMALACIVREPQRFHVTLPKGSPDDLLKAVQVPKGMQLRAVAGMADIPEARLRHLNPGYLGSRIPPHSPGKLLLPAAAAGALTAALADKASEPVAQVDTREQDPRSSNSLGLPNVPDDPLQRAIDSSKSADAAHGHVVHQGETLWSIAHRYHVSVGQLERWNHLSGDDIAPGEELRVRK
ncbi:MAG TPA: transglycosylase SLT domain-containing protein [Rhodanobacteraceae bacterium]|nr:transglycosylase SLT domain-containing protein [Rhodanobacteraceae bacterium]